MLLRQALDGGLKHLPAVAGLPIDKVRIELVGEQRVGQLLEELFQQTEQVRGFKAAKIRVEICRKLKVSASVHMRIN